MSGVDPNASPEQIYASLSPEQRTALAQEFQSHFQQTGAPATQQFANVDPQNTTPQQLADMHQHARENHPGILGKVMQHPVAVAALGAFAAYEIDKHVTGR